MLALHLREAVLSLRRTVPKYRRASSSSAAWCCDWLIARQCHRRDPSPIQRQNPLMVCPRHLHRVRKTEAGTFQASLRLYSARRALRHVRSDAMQCPP